MMRFVTAEEDGSTEHVAREVRRRRQQRSWTLDTAATRLGVSRRLLAQIEAGQGNPSLSTMLSIAAGFDISLVELFAGTSKSAIRLQPDNANAPVLWSGNAGGEARLLVGSDSLEMWKWVLNPGDERNSHAHQPNSKEILLTTQGAVTLTIGSADPVTVREGQSALFRADEPHSYRNDTKKPARFILAVHDPSGMTRP